LFLQSLACIDSDVPTPTEGSKLSSKTNETNIPLAWKGTTYVLLLSLTVFEPRDFHEEWCLRWCERLHEGTVLLSLLYSSGPEVTGLCGVALYGLTAFHQSSLALTEHRNRLPREAVESLSLEILKTRLDAVLCSLL